MQPKKYLQKSIKKFGLSKKLLYICKKIMKLNRTIRD